MSNHLDVVDVSFSVRGNRIAGKHWNPDAENKLIALHGWLDNAASFDVLAPLLKDCSVLALAYYYDFPILDCSLFINQGKNAYRSLQTAVIITEFTLLHVPNICCTL